MGFWKGWGESWVVVGRRRVEVLMGWWMGEREREKEKD